MDLFTAFIYVLICLASLWLAGANGSHVENVLDIIFMIGMPLLWAGAAGILAFNHIHIWWKNHK